MMPRLKFTFYCAFLVTVYCVYVTDALQLTTDLGTRDQSEGVDYKPLLRVGRKELRINTSSNPPASLPAPRKFFLDCGANMASSVLLFRETYPWAKEYIIHSFEIDPQLRPYFAPFESKTMFFHNQGVSNTSGKLQAYLEGAWYPEKVNAHRDMQWGGGSLFAFDNEKNAQDGGSRKLSRHIQVPVVDLSQWIQTNTNKEDYVILKLDVEGAEYGIIKKMIGEGTFDWIDKLYGEFHDWQPTGFSADDKREIRDWMNFTGVRMLDWVGENHRFADFDEMHEISISANTPGATQTILDQCIPKHGHTMVSIVIEIGMNLKSAIRLVDTISAYRFNVPLTLFVYGDFVEMFPDLVIKWSKRFDINIRASGPLPRDHWEKQNKEVLRMSVTSAEQRMKDIWLTPAYILPPGLSTNVLEVIFQRNLRLIVPSVSFPPTRGILLTKDNYHSYRDVERIPKALRSIHEGLGEQGGILSLDSDFPDSYMISVFLMDYLYETSKHKIVSLWECLTFV
ncbi:uncharacterized protein LOC100369061 [Saccoglossus kowalevskii]